MPRSRCMKNGSSPSAILYSRVRSAAREESSRAAAEEGGDLGGHAVMQRQQVLDERVGEERRRALHGLVTESWVGHGISWTSGDDRASFRMPAAGLSMAECRAHEEKNASRTDAP